jgi:hypothetical protein
MAECYSSSSDEFRGASTAWLFMHNMRAIQKVTSSELLIKQAMREKNYYIPKSMYILKLLLNIATTGNMALVILGNKFLYACVKEVCHL